MSDLLIGARLLDYAGNTVIAGPVKDADNVLSMRSNETGKLRWFHKTAIRDDNGNQIFEELHPGFLEEARLGREEPRKVRGRRNRPN